MLVSFLKGEKKTHFLMLLVEFNRRTFQELKMFITEGVSAMVLMAQNIIRFWNWIPLLSVFMNLSADEWDIWIRFQWISALFILKINDVSALLWIDLILKQFQKKNMLFIDDCFSCCALLNSHLPANLKSHYISISLVFLEMAEI